MNVISRYCVLLLTFVAWGGCIRTHGGDGGINRGGGGGATGARAGSGPSGSGGSAGTTPNAGRAGAGAIGGRGSAGSAGGFAVMGAAGSGPAEACRARARESAAVTRISDSCFACTCGAKPSATSACNRTCWRVIECVLTSGCPGNDVACVQMACLGKLNGADGLVEALQLAVSVPVGSCMSECRIP